MYWKAITRIDRRKVEPFVFYLLVAINLLPVVVHPYFPTMDGPSHLYNAQLINSLLFDSSDVVAQYFILNTEPIPNWSGHFILSLFSLFLPALLAEKVLLLLYFIGVPLAFRRLVKTMSPGNEGLSLLILPFTYSFLFLLGFYNFSLAFIAMFLSLDKWMRMRKKDSNLRDYIGLVALLLATYFSHVIVFAVTVMLIGVHFILELIRERVSTNNNAWNKPVIPRMARFVGAMIIPIGLMVFYFWSRMDRPEPQYLETSTLIDWLIQLRPLVVYNPIEEEGEMKLILLALILMVGASFLKRITTQHASWQERVRSIMLHKGAHFFFGAIVTAVLYFYLPDSDSRAGFVSVRLCMILLLLIIFWSLSVRLNRWLSYAIVVLVVYANFSLVKYYDSVIKDLGDIAWQCTEIAEEIEEESVVLPLDLDNHWLTPHFSNYLGIEKSIVILDNYEATNDYFPVIWKNESLPTYTIGSLTPLDSECASWNAGYAPGLFQPDYVFILKDAVLPNNDCVNRIMSEVGNHFTLVKETKNCLLFAANR